MESPAWRNLPLSEKVLTDRGLEVIAAVKQEKVEDVAGRIRREIKTIHEIGRILAKPVISPDLTKEMMGLGAILERSKIGKSILILKCDDGELLYVIHGCIVCGDWTRVSGRKVTHIINLADENVSEYRPEFEKSEIPGYDIGQIHIPEREVRVVEKKDDAEVAAGLTLANKWIRDAQKRKLSRMYLYLRRTTGMNAVSAIFFARERIAKERD